MSQQVARTSWLGYHPRMPKITPFLWFDGNAEEAMNFYTSIFKDAKIGNISRYGEGGPGPQGSVNEVALNPG